MPRKKTFKKRVLECIGKQKPTSWGTSVGLSNGIITRIFTHDKIPTSPHLITISKALGKSIDWLLTGEDLAGKTPEVYGADKLAHGKVREGQAVYAGKHEVLVTKLVEILDGPNRSNAEAIEQNVNAFHQTKDVPIPGIETGNKDTCDGGQLKKNRRHGERRSLVG